MIRSVVTGSKRADNGYVPMNYYVTCDEPDCSERYVQNFPKPSGAVIGARYAGWQMGKMHFCPQHRKRAKK